jgi:hypothetical protein
MYVRCVFTIVWVVAGMVLAGCATHRASLNELPAEEFAGFYVSGPGESWFHACGAAEGESRAWVTFTEGSVAQMEEARATGRLVPGQRHFVRWRAAVATDGRVGPGGPGARSLLVRDILEIAPAGGDPCARDGIGPDGR